jgi:hypothetical protein
MATTPANRNDAIRDRRTIVHTNSVTAIVVKTPHGRWAGMNAKLHSNLEMLLPHQCQNGRKED